MKKITYILIAILFITTSCTNDPEAIHWRQNITDLNVYAGSDDGGVMINFDNIEDKEGIINKYIGSAYKKDRYSSSYVNFISDSKLEYLFADSDNSSKNYKILGNYQFISDSLFVYTAKDSAIFIAEGNKQQFYFTKSFVKYKIEEIKDGKTIKKDVIEERNYTLNLDSVKAITKNPLTDKNDTISWINVKYYFN